MMKQNLAALELHYLIKELQSLVGSKLDQVYNPAKKELFLQFHVPSLGSVMLRIVAGKLIYRTEYKAKSESAGNFCMYLRKQLSGCRLRRLEQKGFERVVEFEFENAEGKKSLFIELFGKGNIILTKDNIILSAVEQQKWADRAVMPKSEYIYPKKEVDFLKMSEQEFREFCKLSKQESIVKALAMELGLGRTYAEEACMRAGIDKNLAPDAGRKKLEALYSIFKEFRAGNKGYIYRKDADVLEISPVQLKIYEGAESAEFPDYNSALDDYFTSELKKEKEASLLKASTADSDKVNKIIEVQRKVVFSLEAEELENRMKGELIYINYQLISEILLQMREAVKKFKPEEIKKRLQGQVFVKNYNEKDKTITVELA